MTFRNTRGRLVMALSVFAACLSLGGGRACAQLAVIDAASLKEATLEAQQSLQQINNQVTQIQQFVQMLQNDERNLTALPFSVVAQLDQSIAQITALMGQAEGLVYNVQGVEAQFQRFYPSSIGAATPDLQLASDAQTRWQYSLASFQNTMQVQSQIVQGLTADQAQMDALVAQSQGATGALQATQAGNQLIALHAKQLTALQALLAAQARAQALEQARAAAAEGQGYAQYQRFLSGAPAPYAPAPVTMFH